MAEDTREMSNLEGALKPFSNTFDSIRGDVNSIIAQQDEMMKLYPDQRAAISRMAEDQIKSILADAGVSLNSYRKALNTDKKYSQELTADPFVTTTGIARALGQGIFLGAGDELEAFVTHMIKNKLLDLDGDKEQTYMDVLTDIQAGISAFERKNPGISLTSEILGGLYFPYYTGLVRGARGLTKGLKLGPGGREATAQGLIGAGAGTFYSYAKDRNVTPLDPLVGGGTAAGFSRALTKTGELRRAADQDIADIEKGFQTQVSGPGGVQVDAEKTIPLMTKLKCKLPNVPAAPGGPPGKPPGELGEAGSQSFHEAAMREIIQAADDEGVTFQDLMMRLDEYVKANLGEHTRMIDLVEEQGHVARTIKGLVLDNPKASVAKKDFVQRQKEAKQRMIPKIFSLFDPQGKMKSVGNNIDRWRNRSKDIRQKNAQPLYEQFDKITIFDPSKPLEGTNLLGAQLSQRLRNLMEYDTAVKKAWTQAKGQVAWHDKNFAHTADEAFLNGQRFNSFKKKLDGQIGELLRKGNLEEAGDLVEVKNEMIQIVDNIVEQATKAKPGEGVYQRARNIYSGSHASDNAFELGAGAVKGHTITGKNYSADQFEVLFDKLSASEKGFARLGLGQGIREALEKDMTKIAPDVKKLILGGTEPNHLERKFHYVFQDDIKIPKGSKKSGKQRSKEFVDILNKEEKFLQSYKDLFTGSQTAPNQSDINRVTNKISDVVDTVADLGPEALIRQGVPSAGLFSKGGNYISSKFSETKRRQLAREKYGSEISEILMTPGGTVSASKLKKILGDLDSYKNQLDLEKGLLGFSPYKQGTRLGKYSLLQPTPVPDVVFPTDVWENK